MSLHKTNRRLIALFSALSIAAFTLPQPALTEQSQSTDAGAGGDTWKDLDKAAGADAAQGAQAEFARSSEDRAGGRDPVADSATAPTGEASANPAQQPEVQGSSSAGTAAAAGEQATTGMAAQEEKGEPASARPSTPAQPSAAGQPAQPKKPLVLYGRIEELTARPGAVLPLKALTPKMDTSQQTLAGGAQKQEQQLQARTTVVSSFPVDWSGYWGGTLTIWTSQYDKIAWDFDPAAASKEVSLLKPGTNGSVTFTFTNQGGKVAVEPAQVVFTSTMSNSQYAESMKQMQQQMQQQMAGNPFASLLGAGNSPLMSAAMMQMPYMYALHLGDLKDGIGVTGNRLQGRVLKNEIRELQPGVLEQVIVTQVSDTSRATGQTRMGYSESVLRFTRMNSRQLYVQAASVKYRNDGRFENKVVLYGTVNRGQANLGLPATGPGMGGMGLPGSGSGAGLGALEQLMRQMQQSFGQ